MSLRLLPDRILGWYLEEEEQKRGGIIIPDPAKEKPHQATVLAVGSGRITEDGRGHPLEVQVGDRMVFGKYAGTEDKMDSEELLLIREDDVLGMLE